MTPVIILTILLSLCSFGGAFRCEGEENLFGITMYSNCPGILDPPSAEYCCGTKENRRCCDNPFNLDHLDLDKEDLEALAENLPTIIAVLSAVAFGLVVLCLVCCCCCPFCLLHKRKNRGAVHQPPAAQMQAVHVPQQQSQAYAPVQTGPYPTQTGPYSTQPMTGYSGPPPPAAAPYPTNAPYPVQTSTEQPPPYSEKQAPYNPNY